MVHEERYGQQREPAPDANDLADIEKTPGSNPKVTSQLMGIVYRAIATHLAHKAGW
jgi:hypothetical protein